MRRWLFYVLMWGFIVFAAFLPWITLWVFR